MFTNLSRFIGHASRHNRVKPAELFLLGAVLALAGCGREDIRVYDAPKERVAERAAAPSTAPALPPITTPAGWVQQPSDQFSLVKFTVQGKDGAMANITVSSLPPSDEAKNVNRWRGQVGLEPASAEELARLREPAKIGGHDAARFDLAGTTPDTQKKTRIVAVMAQFGGDMWFFKMMGDDELVAEQKAAFTKFTATFPLPGHDHPIEETAPAPTAPPAKVAAPPPAQTEPATTSSGRWKAPASWKEEAPGAMQEAKFTAANGKAVVTISIFPGETGGLRANVDRWRRQIGLGPIGDEELPKVQSPLDLPGATATVVDMNGKEQRMVVALVVRGESTWFIKLLGEAAAVESEKKAFLEFVKTTK